MSTAIVLGNGNLLVNIDQHLNVYDVYWPHVGEENHLSSVPNQLFFYENGGFTQLADNDWSKSPGYLNNNLVGSSDAVNDAWKLSIRFHDFVFPHKDIFIRKLKIKNLSNSQRDLLVFFKHNFFLREDDVGDTAVWYPQAGALVHYKKNSYLACGTTDKIHQFTCAGPNDHGGKGAYPDPTGNLEGNPVSTGSVQSCFSIAVDLAAGGLSEVDYFLVCGKDYSEVTDLADYVRRTGNEGLFAETYQYWQSWLTKSKSLDFFGDERDLNLLDLYHKSFYIIRTQTDNSGAIVAANDSRFIKSGGKDSYSYFWPRDAANTCLAYINNGYQEQAANFFTICERAITRDGYMMHKYYPNIDKGLASSWHPWIDQFGNPQLPIQEDETALVIYALERYLSKFNDDKLINRLWNNLIMPALNFLIDYRYIEGAVEKFEHPMTKMLAGTGLPRPGYDIWEIHWGVHSYTVATVFAGLTAGGKLAEFKGLEGLVRQCRKAATEIKESYLQLFLDQSEQFFINSIYCDRNDDCAGKDYSVDASVSALWKYEMFDVTDPKLEKTMQRVVDRLTINTEIGGIARKENDNYFRRDERITGNPWFISTLWLAQYRLLRKEYDLAKPYLDWVLKRADQTGLLAEQADPHTGFALSMKPLTWSHTELITAVDLLRQNT